MTILLLLVLSPQPRRSQNLEAKAEARSLEAEAGTEAGTLEIEATKFWPRETTRPRQGLKAQHPFYSPSFIEQHHVLHAKQWTALVLRFLLLVF